MKDSSRPQLTGSHVGYTVTVSEWCRWFASFQMADDLQWISRSRTSVIFFAQFCSSSWQDFDWQSAPRSISLTTVFERLTLTVLCIHCRECCRFYHISCSVLDDRLWSWLTVQLDRICISSLSIVSCYTSVHGSGRRYSGLLLKFLSFFFFFRQRISEMALPTGNLSSSDGRI